MKTIHITYVVFCTFQDWLISKETALMGQICKYIVTPMHFAELAPTPPVTTKSVTRFKQYMPKLSPSKCLY